MRINGQEVWVNSEGRAAYTFHQPGTYTIEAIVTDKQGATVTRSITVEARAPSYDFHITTVWHTAPERPWAGYTATFGIETNNPQGIASRTLTINGQNIDLTAWGQGTFTFPADGTYTIVATATDIYGNTATHTSTIIVGEGGQVVEDTTPPVVTIRHDAPDVIQAGTEVAFTVDATDDRGIASRTLSVNGRDVALDSNGHGRFVFTEPGTYTIIATATDTSGNVSTESLTLEIAAAPAADTTAPTVDITHNAPAEIFPGDMVDFHVTASDDTGVIAQSFTINGLPMSLGADGTFAFTFGTPGTYVVIATATDAAGNVGTKTVIFQVAALRDTTAPVVNITHNAESKIHPGSEVELTVTATDDTGVTSITLLVNGMEVPVGTDGKVFYSFHAAGRYEIIAAATDAAGNVGTKTVVIEVEALPDTTAPAVKIDYTLPETVRAGDAVRFTVTTSDDASVVTESFTVNGTPVAIGPDGTVNHVFASAGTYEIIVTATDAAGNVGSETITIEVAAALDTTAPVVTISHNAPARLHPGQTVE
ncbi:MAG: PKD domain-containing protein, partial [Planctomycetaceae bacterium]|nr:PKD domain-containing protein [Planctomycetaceae bacterium]